MQRPLIMGPNGPRLVSKEDLQHFCDTAPPQRQEVDFLMSLPQFTAADVETANASIQRIKQRLDNGEAPKIAFTIDSFPHGIEIAPCR